MCGFVAVWAYPYLRLQMKNDRGKKPFSYIILNQNKAVRWTTIRYHTTASVTN